MRADGEHAGLTVQFPPLDLCTDNAAMIACVGAARAVRGEATSLDIGADPNLRLTM
jgi:N6-L-threonylcarbamoyladenine synthase